MFLIDKYKEKIFSIKDHDQFQSLSLEAFDRQYKNNLVYKEYVDMMGIIILSS